MEPPTIGDSTEENYFPGSRRFSSDGFIVSIDSPPPTLTTVIKDTPSHSDSNNDENENCENDNVGNCKEEPSWTTRFSETMIEMLTPFAFCSMGKCPLRVTSPRTYHHSTDKVHSLLPVTSRKQKSSLVATCWTSSAASTAASSSESTRITDDELEIQSPSPMTAGENSVENFNEQIMHGNESDLDLQNETSEFYFYQPSARTLATADSSNANRYQLKSSESPQNNEPVSGRLLKKVIPCGCWSCLY